MIIEEYEKAPNLKNKKNNNKDVQNPESGHHEKVQKEGNFIKYFKGNRSKSKNN